jgi:hypothetical protein
VDPREGADRPALAPGGVASTPTGHLRKLGWCRSGNLRRTGAHDDHMTDSDPYRQASSTPPAIARRSPDTSCIDGPHGHRTLTSGTCNHLQPASAPDQIRGPGTPPRHSHAKRSCARRARAAPRPHTARMKDRAGNPLRQSATHYVRQTTELKPTTISARDFRRHRARGVRRITRTGEDPGSSRPGSSGPISSSSQQHRYGQHERPNDPARGRAIGLRTRWTNRSRAA